MKIGIDIDGVIVDTNNFVAKELSKILKRDVEADEVAHRLRYIEGIVDIFKEKGDYFLCSLDPYEHVVNVINKIKEHHEIYIISARFNLYYDKTLEWLKSHGINFDKVIFTEGKSKINVCDKYGIELFIEDSVINANELADEGIQVIIYSAEYNKDLNRKDIVRCDNWKSILSFVNNVKNQTV